MNQPLDTLEDENKKGENKRETFKQAFRRRLFQVYFELMRDRNIDFVFAAVMMIVNFVQMYGLLYNTKTDFPFKDDLYDTIAQLCDLVRVYPILEGADTIYYWIVSFGLIVVLFVYLTSLFYIDYSLKIEKFYFMFPIKTLKFLSSFVFWLFMQPIIEIFISIFSCKDGFHLVDKSLECLSGIHIFYCILFALSLFGYFVVFLLISFFYNESRPYHTDAFARLDANFETYVTLYKFVIAIVGHFLYDQTLHWLIITIHILGAINFCKMYLKYLPYYSQRTSVLYGACWFAYLWIALNILLLKALESADYQGQSIVIIVGLVLVYPATKQIRNSKIQRKIFQKKHDKIKSEYELDIFIHKLYRLIIDQHVNEVDEMILLGLVHNHQSECLNNECPLNTTEELYLPANDSMSDRKIIFSKDPILLYHLINSIYAEYAKSSNSTAVLHTTYAYFLFYQIGNIHTALLELNVAEKCDTNYQQKFTIYRAKRFIENYLVNKFAKNKELSQKQTFAELDVTIVITFESLFARLNKEIEKSANDHIEFWSHLDSQMVDLNVLHKLGLNIINNTKRINEIWHQLTRINQNYPKALQIYGNYLVQIKNDINEGEEFLNQASAMGRPRSLDEHINDFELMFAEDTAIVVISGNKDSQAKIMKTNNGITKLFGYNTFEVHGHEVNILMPPIIGVKHNYFLDQFFKTGKERVINADLSTFAMLRVGHIFSVTLIVKPVPSLKNDIQYIGLLKPTNRDYDFILTDQYGRIDSISKGITSMLQLQATFFKENEIFIQVLCPQLCETEKVKGSKDQQTKFDLWTGVKDLTFIVPRNFSNLSQKSGGRSTSNMNNANQMRQGAGYNENDDDENSNNRRGAGEPSFVGLKSPDHLKKVCNMFRNNDFKAQPHKYLSTLKNNINYDNPEIYKGPVKTEIINRTHGNGYLQLKVYKILNPKRAGTTGESDSARGVVNAYQNKNVRVMLDEASKKLETITSEDLQKRIYQMKLAIDQIKKGLRHATAKQKPSNISTPGMYEKAEVEKYLKEIYQLELKLREIKQREEEKVQDDEGVDDKASDSGTGSNVGFGVANKPPKDSSFFKGKPTNSDVEEKDFLLKDNTGIDYEGMKNMYPLKENAGALSDLSKSLINQQDISAVLQDDSMLQEKGLLVNDVSQDYSNQRRRQVQINNQDMYDDMEDNFGNTADHMQDGDQRLDLLKDIRRKQQDTKKKVVKKDEGAKEGEEAGGEGTGESTGDTSAEDAEEEKLFEDDTGSVASSTKSLMKHLRMLRNALYENYSPPSIRNLKMFVKIIFLLILLITIVWYVQSKNIYIQVKDNIHNIHSSKNRMNSLTDIGADVRILTFMQNGRVNRTRGGRNYELFKRDSLVTQSSYIQQAQNNLSNTYLIDIFSEANKNLVNPKHIQLIYNNPCALPMFYYVDVWSAVMSVAVHALTVRDMPLRNITMNQTSVFVIITNALNNILQEISGSTDAILDETVQLSDSVDMTLQILLYVASGILFFSICLIFPVATKVDKNKDELLRNFMLIDRDDVKKQLEKCRIFFNTMHDKEHVTQQNMGDLDDEDYKDEDGKEGEEVDPNNPNGVKNKKGQRQRTRKNKMHKKFSTNFISLLIKFLVVLTVLEGYFLLCYLRSINFLHNINNLIDESGTIAMRQFSNNFLYQIMQEVLTTNGTAQVKNTNSLSYIFGYLNETIKEQEAFLKTHSSNAAYHSSSFNSFFDLLIYQNVCDAIYSEDPTSLTACNTFMGGILRKGLYSANVAYWDNMRSMATDFNNSARSNSAIDTLLNSDRLVENENLKDVYFADSYKRLLRELDLSLFYNFDDKDREDTILFSVYVVVLALLYFILWNKFMEATRHSLWVTKSMLAIIPLEIIQKVPKIKDFLLASSKNTLSAFKD